MSKNILITYKIILLLYVFISSVQPVRSASSFYKVCTAGGQDAVCQQLQRSQELLCNKNYHDVDCALHIESAKSDIGRISKEAAMIAANFLSNNTIVLGEIQSNYPPLKTVVIVRNTVEDGFNSLQGKKLCHPGFKHDYMVPNLILREFTDKLIQLNEQAVCSIDKTTITEKEFKYLSETLGDSCMPGPWTQDVHLDSIYKGQYSNLCKLCTSQSCDESYTNPFNDSLSCLLNHNGDVAVTALHEVLTTFNSSTLSSSSSSNFSNNYKYLCKNGTSSSDLNNPCTWTEQINDLIIAAKSTVNDVRNIIEKKLSSASDDVTGGEALRKVLQLRKFERIEFVNQSSSNYPSLSDFVKERRDVPTNATQTRCNTTVKFCTTSTPEQAKCLWFSQAAINRGIQPVVECVQSENVNEEISCLNDVRKGRADIFVLSTDYIYLANKQGLTPIAYLDLSIRGLSTVLIVVKSNSSISSFQDLKGRKSSFPRYGGKEWLAFIDTGRKLGLIGNGDYETLISEYLGESCMPGAFNEAFNSVDNEKFCNLCAPLVAPSTARFCTDDNSNKYYGSSGALQCLNDSISEFAVITKDMNRNYLNISGDLSGFKVLCKNGSLASVPGLDVDKECGLNTLPSSIVVSKSDNPKNPDLISFIYAADRWFGQDLNKAFNLYDQFNDTRNLLYKDSTIGQNLISKTEYNDNIVKMLTNIKGTDVVIPSNSSARIPLTFTSHLLAIIFLLNALFVFCT